jgi:hypothetical protein
MTNMTDEEFRTEAIKTIQEAIRLLFKNHETNTLTDANMKALEVLGSFVGRELRANS